MACHGLYGIFIENIGEMRKWMIWDPMAYFAYCLCFFKLMNLINEERGEENGSFILKGYDCFYFVYERSYLNCEVKYYCNYNIWLFGL